MFSKLILPGLRLRYTLCTGKEILELGLIQRKRKSIDCESKHLVEI